MRKVDSFKILVVLLAIIIVGCNEYENDLPEKGSIRFEVAIGEAVGLEVTKSESNGLNSVDNCVIRIYNKDGLIDFYEGVENLPSELWLVSGDYTVTVEAGNSVPASFDAIYYKGNEEFTITAGSQNNTNIVADIANVLSTVVFKDELVANFQSYKVEVFTIAGEAELLFDEDNNGSTGYFMMPSGITGLGYRFSGVNTAGETVTRSGTINNVKSATNYILNFNYDSNYEDGGLIVNLRIVDKTDPDEDDNVVFYMPPAILLSEGNISEYSIVAGSGEDINIWVTGSSEIKSVKFTVDALTQSAFNLPVAEFDFMEMSESTLDDFASEGFFISDKSNSENEEWYILITIKGEKVQTIEAGEYTFTIYAEDEKAKSKEVIFNMSVVQD